MTLGMYVEYYIIKVFIFLLYVKEFFVLFLLFFCKQCTGFVGNCIVAILVGGCRWCCYVCLQKFQVFLLSCLSLLAILKV